MKPKTTLLLIALLTLSLAPVAAANWSESKAYFYDAAGNVTTIGTETYAYDSVDRLISGHLAATERRYEFDAFGNRTKCTDVASGSDCQMGALITADTNRITGATYDEAGGLQSYGGVAYEYDDVGMLRHSSGSGIQEYVYTADDERIAVIASAHWQWTLRDLSGKVMREMSSTAGATGYTNWQWTRDNVFRNGSLLSSKQDSGGTITTRHYHLDHLGTPRIVSDESGILLSQHDYFPFGLEVPGNPREANATPLQFTGHERDAATNLDYMHARYYDAGWGRFLSVDPTWDSADLGRPQSWNRYSYVLNDPINYTDPDGRCTIVLDCPFTVPPAVVGVAIGFVLVKIAGIEVGDKSIGRHVGDFMLSGSGSSGEMAAEMFAQNMSNYMAEQADLPELPVRDATGKIHTNEQGLPTAEDLQKYPTEELQQFQDELKGSVGERIKTTSSLPDQTKEQRVKHAERQAEEQRLIKDIDKIIKDRD